MSPVCLPWSEDDNARGVDVGDKALVTGWGRVDNNIRRHYRFQIKNRAGSRTLLKVNLPIISEEDCKNAGSSFKTIDGKTQMCAGAEKGMFIIFFTSLKLFVLLTGSADQGGRQSFTGPIK